MAFDETGLPHHGLLLAPPPAQDPVVLADIMPPSRQRALEELDAARTACVNHRSGRQYTVQQKLDVLDALQRIMQVEGMRVRRSDAQKLTGVSPSTLQRWWAQRAELEAAAARLRLKDRLRRWKIFAFVIGRIVCLHRRAAQRVYAPGGNGYVLVAATTLVGR